MIFHKSWVFNFEENLIPYHSSFLKVHVIELYTEAKRKSALVCTWL